MTEFEPSIDLINKVVKDYSLFKQIQDAFYQDRTNWYEGVQTKHFAKHTIDKWGFRLYNQTDHLKQNYASWQMRIHDEQKYTLFLLRY
jgi:hypothetical protein